MLKEEHEGFGQTGLPKKMKMRVRYSRQGGAVVADTLPELIFDIVMVVVLFHCILLYHSCCFYILYGIIDVCIL